MGVPQPRLWCAAVRSQVLVTSGKGGRAERRSSWRAQGQTTGDDKAGVRWAAAAYGLGVSLLG